MKGIRVIRGPGKWILLFFLYLLSTPVVSRLGIQMLEQQYPPLLMADCPPERPCHIVVLGAGKNNDTRLPPNVRLSPNALARLVEGLRHYKAGEDRVLITSGPFGRGEESQAAIMKATAHALGADTARIHLLEEVVNTHTEAELYTRLFGTDATVILCTSASHLPRAMKWFRHYGVENIHASPSLYLAPAGEAFRLRWLLPSSRSLVCWYTTARECVGHLIFEVNALRSMR